MWGDGGDAEAAGRLLLAVPADTADVVLQDVEALLTAADPRFWIALEGARLRLCRDVPGTALVRPAISDTVPGLTVKALSPDGRTRERAVRLLAQSGSLAALPVLALRAADWVPNVRSVARHAIARRLDDDIDGAALAAVAPMALLLAGRTQGRRLAEEVTRRFAGAASGPVVARLLASQDVRLRRTAYQALIGADRLDLERAVQAAALDPDIVIRGRCAEYAARLAVDAGTVSPIRRLLASRTPLVRVEALGALNRLADFETIQAALPDRSSLVRGTARFYLRPRGVDFAEIHRRLLSDRGDTVTPGAVAGLAEVGTAADADLFGPLLRHPRVAVRVEAVRGLLALSPAIDVPGMLALVQNDQSASVVRQATAALLARGPSIDPEYLLAMLDPARRVPVRLAARRLLASRDGVWRLAADVALLADHEERVAVRAKNDLVAALRGQLYTSPGGRAAEVLAAHLPDADRILTQSQAWLLRIVVGMPRVAQSAEPGAAD